MKARGQAEEEGRGAGLRGGGAAALLRQLPNLLTLLRMLLTVPVIALLAEGRFGWALILFAVAGVSDALDGFLAKRFGWGSRLGAVLDPLADKFLLVSTYLVLGLQGWLPPWLVALVVLRDLVVLAGAAAYYLVVGPYRMAPSRISKLNTFAQILLALCVVLALAGLPFPPPLLGTLVAVVAGTTLWSGVDYVWTWSRKAVEAKRARRAAGEGGPPAPGQAPGEGPGRARGEAATEAGSPRGGEGDRRR